MSTANIEVGALDSDLLRTFLAVADAGSISAGATRIYRSQSAASLQIKQLEELLGRPVFDRHGRGVTLTPAGERLQPVARQVVGQLDSVLADLRQAPLAGALRVGIADEYGQDVLTRAIGRFARDHPRVDLDIRGSDSSGFPAALADDRLDLAVYEVEVLPPDAVLLYEEPTHWVTARRHRAHRRTPLPVALFDRDCWWRTRALHALDAAGRPYRVAFSSERVGAITAAIRAGIAVGLLGRSALADDLAVLEDFPAMPSSKLVLKRRADTPAARAMADAIQWAFRDYSA
ncbi:MAG: LysR substrate-binding domain-containing protein [Alphaproteobacteria bacterium]